MDQQGYILLKKKTISNNLSSKTLFDSGRANNVLSGLTVELVIDKIQPTNIQSAFEVRDHSLRVVDIPDGTGMVRRHENHP